MLDKTGAFVPDTWAHLADDEAAPASGDVTISVKRWQAERERWIGYPGRLGLRLPNDAQPGALSADIRRFALIVLDFPRFVDGRAYSQARLLRARYGFKGELRASGNVLRDQLLFMKRCGFDSFVVDQARAQAEDWARAFREFDLFYQPAQDGAATILRQRLRDWQSAAE